MLSLVTNWKSLTTALRSLGMGIYHCHDCGHVWLSANKPVRCPRRDCRAWANAPRYKHSGRPGESDLAQRFRREYLAYCNAKYRCTNPKNGSYPDYGGRGIEFRFTSFPEFIKHIGPKPSPQLSLDRINNQGHYEIGNVHWGTAKEQGTNKRKRRKAEKE